MLHRLETLTKSTINTLFGVVPSVILAIAVGGTRSEAAASRAFSSTAVADTASNPESWQQAADQALQKAEIATGKAYGIQRSRGGFRGLLT